MAIILELNPAMEARLIQQAAQHGVPVSRYIETLLATPPSQPKTRKSEHAADAYLARVHQVLKQLDQLPRPASNQSSDEIIGFDEWGFPAR